MNFCEICIKIQKICQTVKENATENDVHFVQASLC